ncbi:MgtC/SapB family protein [Sphaerospermopsis aphanizomenoides BCCUSP55]|uniref:MgtC/SapB family protein n=1 Tax=Sphaerospermopsis aphanizomenoides TaxID=459663 RepID=UPI001907DD23|nr:MgtC/SapB family protein [Sphaerospermopsis aphanizomenoides]MBK1986037.1 MgtC/SapB family protein [Sphaerospermopsis aphanizomenoides BCCUSP55]
MTNPYYIPSDDWFNICLRLCLALLIGAIIGLEREITNKPAGLRTYMLVSMGSAIFTLTTILIGGPQLGSDSLSRVIQGIAAGVGFLGGGEIWRESSQPSKSREIYGLTSAAAIWVAAALGIAAGCGLWQLGLIGGILTVIVLHLLKRVEKFH